MHLTTFGGLHLTGSAVKRPKLLTLLAYLALEGPQGRAFLRDLFWPDASDAAGSLRAALAYLQAHARGALVTSGSLVRTEVTCDAVTFLAKLDEGRLEHAVEGYQGAFLPTLERQLPTELQEWVLGTRDVLAEQARTARLKLGERHASRHDFHRGAQQARAAWTLLGAPPATPEVMEPLHRLLVAGEDQATALDVERAAAEYGLTLRCSPVEAQAALQGQSNDPCSPQGVRRSAADFIGRAPVLASLADLLGQADIRLVTLLGPGGVGKTRLALEAAAHSPVPCTFVRLEGVTDAALLPGAVAAGLGISGGTREIQAHLSRSASLLVLDDFEHLQPAAGFVEDLLELCPPLTVLITSRQRLGVPGEWLLPLTGLEVPAENASHADALQSEAAQLFQRRARQVQPDWTPSDPLALAAVCRLLDGQPLALELAASLVRVLPLAELVTEIQQDLSVLDASSPASQRHPGLSAVFEQSWAALSPPERAVVARISVGHSSMRRAALTAIAGATLPLLTALVDKSFIHVQAPGRYTVHPLLRAFAVRRLSAAEHDAAERRFVEHHLSWLEDTERGAGSLPAGTLEEEWSNVRQLWSLAPACGQARRLLTLRSLPRYLERHAAYTEGHRRYAALAHVLEGDPDAAASARSFAAWFAFRMGDPRLAVRAAQEVLDALQRLSLPASPLAPQARCRALNTLAGVHRAAGASDQALVCWSEAYEVARAHGDTAQEAMYLTNLAILHAERRDLEKASSAHQEALVLARRLGDPASIALAGSHLARLQLSRADLGDPHELLQLLSEMLHLAEQGGHTALVGYLSAYAAQIHLRLGNSVMSRTHADQVQEIAQTKGLRTLQITAALTYAELDALTGQNKRAWAWLHLALQDAVALKDWSQLAGALLLTAELTEPAPAWWPHLAQLTDLSERELHRMQRLTPPATPVPAPPSLNDLARDVLRSWPMSQGG